MDNKHRHIEKILSDLQFWQFEQLKKPSLTSKWTAQVQKKLNNLIPEKVHNGFTAVIKTMVQTVLFGSEYTAVSKPPTEISFIHREALVKAALGQYAKTGAAEGGVTGAGGFLMSVADFPLLLGIKIKMLFDIATYYGMDVKDYKERLYILYIFQLAFSSPEGRIKSYNLISSWQKIESELPLKAEDFDWRTFQQEYRDFIDIAKLAQMLPVVGAAVGAIANYKLIQRLGNTAMMCYRMRWLEDKKLIR